MVAARGVDVGFGGRPWAVYVDASAVAWWSPLVVFVWVWLLVRVWFGLGVGYSWSSCPEGGLRVGFRCASDP